MDALKRLSKYLGDPKNIFILSSAPARLDFLNTHQDYKGLPVVSIAINRRIYIAQLKASSQIFCFESLDLYDRRCYSQRDIEIFDNSFADYLRSALILAKRKWGINLKDLQLNVVISSDIPIGSGLGSSGALLVAFIKLLSELLGKKLSSVEIAEYAYIAEREILGIPCGRLDQYSSAIGGVIYLTTRPPIKYKRLNLPSRFKLAVIDSGIQHRTKNIHSERQRELELAISEILRQDVPEDLQKKLKGQLDEIAWSELEEEELQTYLEHIPSRLANRVLFTILMNKLTEIAVKLLEGKQLGHKENSFLRRMNIDTSNVAKTLCGIVDKQHELLRDLYEVSLPEIEAIREAISTVGKVCSKISGAGMGGSIIVLYEENFDKLMKKALDAGAKRVMDVRVDKGVRIEKI